MNILVNGSSISRGPGSWPYHLQQDTNCDLVNLAVAGAGYTYIHETTVTALAERRYDLALIMWPESGRLDFRVDYIDRFDDSKNTSKYQSSVNTWPEKIKLNEQLGYDDQELVQKNWIFSLGHLQGQQDNVAHLFKSCHAFIKHEQILERELVQLISLQGVLKAQGTPYLFMFWQPFKRFDRFEKYYAMIDWSMVYTQDYLEDITKRNNWFSEDGVHPSSSAHQRFAELIVERLDF